MEGFALSLCLSIILRTDLRDLCGDLSSPGMIDLNEPSPVVIGD